MDNKMSLKMTLGDDCRRIAASPNMQYEELLEQIATIFRLTKDQLSEIVVGYVDDEKDLCIVSSTEELNEAFRCNAGLLRLTLSFKVKPVEEPVTPAPRRKCGMGMKRRIQLLRDLEDQGLKMMETDLNKAIELFSQQVEASPRWQIFRPLYNIACCHALLGDSKAAVAVLSKSIHAGFRDVDHMRTDPDLASLHEIPEFQQLLALIPTLGERVPRCRRFQCVRPCQKEEEAQPQPPLEGSPVQAVFDLISDAVNNQLPNAAALLREQLQVLQNGAMNAWQFNAEAPKPEPEAPKAEPEVQPEVQPEPVPEPVAAEPILEVDSTYRASLTVLQEMGFNDLDANLAALMTCEGDLSAVLSRLLDM
jgi:hypothetical protein